MLYSQLKIDDYHIYDLRLSLIDVVQLERLLGESPLDILQKAAINSVYGISLEDLVYILYVSLQGGETKYTIDDAYDIFDDYIENVGDIGSFLNTLIRLFIDMGFISGDDDYYDEVVDEDADNESNNEDVLEEDVSLETRFKRLLVKCLEAGITEEFFWNSTYGEMLRFMKAYSNRLLRERQDKAFFDYQLSNLIGISVSRLFSSDSKFPEIHEAYPSIFEPPSEDEKAMLKAMEMKARMLEYAEQHNAKQQLKEIEELYGIKIEEQK
jgi:hypothetical protein